MSVNQIPLSVIRMLRVLTQLETSPVSVSLDIQAMGWLVKKVHVWHFTSTSITEITYTIPLWGFDINNDGLVTWVTNYLLQFLVEVVTNLISRVYYCISPRPPLLPPCTHTCLQSVGALNQVLSAVLELLYSSYSLLEYFYWVVASSMLGGILVILLLKRRIMCKWMLSW